MPGMFIGRYSAKGNARLYPSNAFRKAIQPFLILLLLAVSLAVYSADLPPNNLPKEAISPTDSTDNEPPVVSGCSGPYTFRSFNLTTCAQSATWTEPTAFDQVSGRISYYRRTHIPGALLPVGRTIVTYYFRDAAGNEATCSITVDVLDTATPVINCQGTITQTDNATNTYSIPELTAYDNCGSVSVTYAVSGATTRSGSGTNASGLFNPGINYLTWTARDFSGNVSTCTSQIIIRKKGCTLATTFSILSSVTPQGNDGKVKILTTGGNAPFTYTIGDLSNDNGEFNSLGEGTYSYVVQDAANCSSEGSFTLPKAGTVVQPLTDCPRDTFIAANPNTCRAALAWSFPTRRFPDIIPIASGLYKNDAVLTLIGELNGHAYYKSNDVYQWAKARELAEKIGGHLVTINSKQESDFIFDNLKESSIYWPWIGLYNTGVAGSWKWITGESVDNFSNWAPGEPNNYAASSQVVEELYAQVQGSDPLHQWNDTRDNATYFVVEVEKPLMFYLQISGPPAGNAQNAGTYTICYIRTNLATGTQNDCCFRVTVTCEPPVTSCVRDTVIAADPSTCTAKVIWPAPNGRFAPSISLPGGRFTSQGSLVFLGEFMGHGYYRSNDVYSWDSARDLSAAAGGHLFTISSEQEANFVRTNLNSSFNGPFDPWIGLYKTDLSSDWKWVTDEPYGAYQNWWQGEPNNFGGSSINLVEKYGQFTGIFWNDQRADRLAFIAEFEKPTLSYRQISGPANGSVLSAGTYQVCYEITNTGTNTVSTCCFRIIVTCPLVNSTSASSKSDMSLVNNDKDGQEFTASVFPNPSRSSFSIKINSSNLQQRVSIIITDVLGRTLETNNVVDPNSVYQFGRSLKAGVYYARVVQGNKKINLRLVKN